MQKCIEDENGGKELQQKINFYTYIPQYSFPKLFGDSGKGIKIIEKDELSSFEMFTIKYRLRPKLILE